MATFVVRRQRCEVNPSTDAMFVNKFTGTSPRIYKGAGCRFEIAFFNTATELFDVSNIVDVTLMVKPVNNPGAAAEILKTVSVIVPVDINAWNNGTGQHVTIDLLGSETNIAAGTHDLTIWGHTQDASIDPDVFGVSRVEIVDAGIAGVTNPTLTPQYATIDQVSAILAGYAQRVLPPGATLTFQSPDGLNKRVIGVANGPTRIDELETVS
jgi:hypothetical protein